MTITQEGLGLRDVLAPRGQRGGDVARRAPLCLACSNLDQSSVKETLWMCSIVLAQQRLAAAGHGAFIAKSALVNKIIYIVGLVVIVAAVLSWLGLR